MRINVKTATTLLALVAVTACAVSAFADTAGASGGSSAPADTNAGSTPSKPKVHATGIATWFGPGFYGKQTACGQTLTPGVVGVANRTLP